MTPRPTPPRWTALDRETGRVESVRAWTAEAAAALGAERLGAELELVEVVPVPERRARLRAA
jgi:hypothetical protein